MKLNSSGWLLPPHLVIWHHFRIAEIQLPNLFDRSLGLQVLLVFVQLPLAPFTGSDSEVRSYILISLVEQRMSHILKHIETHWNIFEHRFCILNLMFNISITYFVQEVCSNLRHCTLHSQDCPAFCALSL